MDCTIKVEEASVETEKITLTKKYNTYVPAKALDFSSVEGLTAYYVTAVTATEATLTPATTVAAGEGIILEGTAGTEYDVPVASGEVTAYSLQVQLLKVITFSMTVNSYYALVVLSQTARHTCPSLRFLLQVLRP